jgi:hypothetical protein
MASSGRRTLLDTLDHHVDSASPKVERALLSLWRSQQKAGPTNAAGFEQDYRLLAAETFYDAWQSAYTAGTNAVNVDVAAEPDNRWVYARGAQFAGWMANEQASALQMVATQGPTLLGHPGHDEIAAYLEQAIGLNSREALALVRYGAKVKEMRKIEKAFMPAVVSQYANRLRQSRAAQIATTELAAAFNAGKDAIYRLGASLGLISEKVWICQDDPCPECEALDGTTVPAGTEFPSGDPPLHLNCRCSTDSKA